MTTIVKASESEGRPLKKSITIGWAIGELAIAAFVVLQMAFMLFYCTEALHIPPAIAGFALLLPRLLDAFADPLMGALSDRTKSKLGRRRFYLALGAPLLAISFGAVFFIPPEWPIGPKVALLVVSFMLSNAAVTIYEVPYSSMAAEMTQSYKERTTLAGYKMFAARFTGVLVAYGAPKIFGTQETLAQGFQQLGIVAGALILVTGLWGFFSTKDAPRFEHTPQTFSIKDEISSVLQNKSFAKLWSAFFLQNLAIGVSATTLIYFVTQIMLIPPKDSGQFMFAGALSALVATPIWVFVGRKIGKQRGYIIAIIGAALTAIPALFILPTQIAIFFPILILAGALDAANQLFPNAMVPDTVEVDELRTGLRREGAIFGAWGFARKLGMTGGAFLVSQLLALIHFVPGLAPNLQAGGSLDGIRLIYAAVPLGIWIATFFAFRLYDLSEVRFEQIKQEIKEKK
ncbi:MAG: MFS transporter [Pseudomonadota bacterium]